MQSKELVQLSPFGQRLRSWRVLRAVSQSELALLSGTTPRYVSFIETGRSRPGRELILRIASSLNLPVRASNDLLVAAGLAPEFAARSLDDPQMEGFASVVRTMVERHSPFPACAVDVLGRVHLCNEAFLRLFPRALEMTPEDHVEALFESEALRSQLENWSEVAWAWFDRQRHLATTIQDPRLQRLVERAATRLRTVPRPEHRAVPNEGPAVCARFRVDGKTISTFTATMHFEGAREITASELRVELVFPADAQSAAFFRGLANGYAAE